ncbi:uncharacterized protein LOC115579882 isoform X3 [Sparus aurata]|uniref:uncharacterized protein LOC115579882 isoform X3 n=1 Tax=Sparus aurata TaxID=8175 RepID=UPI0011C199A5|nr:uncharacterized protein LOC115579882 isoform X3 [Sparus aurata]
MATWNSPSKFEKVDEPEVSRVQTDIQLMCYAARDEAVPAKERYRLTVHTGGLAIAVMAKLVRQSRAAEQRAAYLSRRLKERDATIRQQAEKLTQLQCESTPFANDVNEAEMLAVVEEVEQQLERVADDGVREVMDVTPRELSRTRSEGGWAGWS